jgi:hypothetical protein
VSITRAPGPSSIATSGSPVPRAAAPGTLRAVETAPPPRTVTLVLCTGDGRVLGQLPPFEAAAIWWPNAASVVTGARERYGAQVTVLRLLDAARAAPPVAPSRCSPRSRTAPVCRCSRGTASSPHIECACRTPSSAAARPGP